MKPSTSMPQKTYNSIGKCIYCTQSLPPQELTDEHVIPFALNGSLVFKKAACEPCRKHSNEVYENLALQTDLLVPRLLLELKRRKKKKPKSLPHVSLGNQIENTNAIYSIELELKDYPKIFPLIVLNLPGKLSGTINNGSLVSLKFQFVNIATQNSNPHHAVTTKFAMNHTAFGLTLIKIGYCFAVAEKGMEFFDGQDIRNLLAGLRDDIYNFFGSAPINDKSSSSYLHWVSFLMKDTFLVARVHLFASCSVRPYYIVLGTIN